MRASPINPVTIGAKTKMIVVLLGLGRQAMADFSLIDRLQQAVAVQAALEGLNGAEQVKAAQHLDQLLTGIGGPQTVTVRDDVALK